MSKNIYHCRTDSTTPCQRILAYRFFLACITMIGLGFSSLTSCAASHTGSAITTSQLPYLTATAVEPTTVIETTAQSTDLQGNTSAVWDKLQHTSLLKLRSRLAQTTDDNQIAWMKLAIIGKQNSVNTNELIKQLIAWRQAYPNHPGNGLFPDNAALTRLLNVSQPTHIALLLPLQGSQGTQGHAVRDGYLNAYYESVAKNNPQQTISFYDTSKTTNIASLYQQAITQGADMIIGPLTKDNVQQLAAQNNYPVPTIALNYTDIGLGSLPTNFYQFGLSQKDEAAQLAQKAHKKGLSRAIIISSQDPWAQRITKPLIEQWQSQGGTVIDSFYYSSRSNFAEELAKLMHINPKEDRAQMADDNSKSILEQQRRQDFDVIFLVAQPQAGRAIVPLLKYYYADQIPIYSTSMIYSGSPSPQKDADLNGVTFCDLPWVLTKPSQSRTNRLYAVGRDARLISNELQRLILLPHFPIYAATGALTMNANQQIYRRVPWTQMHAGHPQ